MSLLTQELSSDVLVQVCSEKLPVTVGPGLRSAGWFGGLWVRYVEPTEIDEFVVERSDGNEVAGFLAFPSEEYGGADADEGFWGAVNNYTASQLRSDTGSVAGASTVALFCGGGRFLFKWFETQALGAGGARDGGPITYVRNESLKISERGLLCNDPDDRLALAGVGSPVVVGIACAIPTERNGNRLGLDLKF